MAEEIILGVDIKGNEAQIIAEGQRIGATAARAAQSQLDKINFKSVDFSGLTGGLRGVQQQLGDTANVGKQLSDSLELGARRIIAFSAASTAIFGVIKLFRESLAASRELEKSLQNINVVLNLPTTQIGDFGKQLFDIARNTKTSFEDVAKAAVEFSRQGLGVEDILKRTQGALLLVNLAGLDAAEGTKAITSAINSFSKESLDAVEIVNKLVAVDSKFAVSSADLVKAITRVGSTAQEAGVGFDRLISLVTAAQQVSQRGGEVIGTAFQTIFTRLQRKDTLDALQELGIQVREVDKATGQYTGNLLSADRILGQLAGTFKGLTQEQRAQVSEVVAGTRQINVLTSLLNGLRFEQDAYKTSVGATDEAIRRNNALLDTQAAKFTQAQTTLSQLGANVGNVGFGNITKTFLDAFNSSSIIKSLSGTAGDVGNEFGKIFIKSVSDILLGAGLPLILGIGLKITAQLSQILGGFTKQLTPFNKEDASLQEQIALLLRRQGSEVVGIIRSTDSRIIQEQKVLALLQQQSVALSEQAAAKSLATQFLLKSGGAFIARAGGLIPNAAGGLGDAFSRERSAITSGIGGASSSARPVFIPNFETGFGKGVVANTDEYIIPNYAGSGKPAIFNKTMVGQLGLPSNAIKIEEGIDFPSKPSFKPKIIPREASLISNFIREFDEALFQTAQASRAKTITQVSKSIGATVSPQSLKSEFSAEQLTKLLETGSLSLGFIPNCADPFSVIIPKIDKFISGKQPATSEQVYNSLGTENFEKLFDIGQIEKVRAIGGSGNKQFEAIYDFASKLNPVHLQTQFHRYARSSSEGYVPNYGEGDLLSAIQAVLRGGPPPALKTQLEVAQQRIQQTGSVTPASLTSLALSLSSNLPEIETKLQKQREIAGLLPEIAETGLAIRQTGFTRRTPPTQVIPLGRQQLTLPGSPTRLLENGPGPVPLPEISATRTELENTDFIRQVQAQIESLTRQAKNLGILNKNFEKGFGEIKTIITPVGPNPELIGGEQRARIGQIIEPLQNRIETKTSSQRLIQEAGRTLENITPNIEGASSSLVKSFDLLQQAIVRDVSELAKKDISQEKEIQLRSVLNANLETARNATAKAQTLGGTAVFEQLQNLSKKTGIAIPGEQALAAAGVEDKLANRIIQSLLQKQAATAVINERIEDADQLRAQAVQSGIPFGGLLGQAKARAGRIPRLSPEAAGRLGGFGNALAFGGPFAAEGIGSFLAGQTNDEITKERIGRGTSGVGQAASLGGVGLTIAASAGAAAGPIAIVAALGASFLALKSVVDNSKDSIEDLGKRVENRGRELANASQAITTTRAATFNIQQLAEGGATPVQIRRAQEAALRQAESIENPNIRQQVKNQIIKLDFTEQTNNALNTLQQDIETQGQKNLTLSPENVSSTIQSALKQIVSGAGFKQDTAAQLRLIGQTAGATPNNGFTNLSNIVSAINPIGGVEAGQAIGKGGINLGAFDEARKKQEESFSKIGDIFSKNRLPTQDLQGLFSAIREGGPAADKAKETLAALVKPLSDAAKGYEENIKAIDKDKESLAKLTSVTLSFFNAQEKLRGINSAFIDDINKFNVQRLQTVTGQTIGLGTLQAQGVSGAEIDTQKFKNALDEIEGNRTKTAIEELNKFKNQLHNTFSPDVLKEISAKVGNLAPNIQENIISAKDSNELISRLSEIDGAIQKAGADSKSPEAIQAFAVSSAALTSRVKGSISAIQDEIKSRTQAFDLQKLQIQLQREAGQINFRQGLAGQGGVQAIQALQGVSTTLPTLQNPAGLVGLERLKAVSDIEGALSVVTSIVESGGGEVGDALKDFRVTLLEQGKTGIITALKDVANNLEGEGASKVRPAIRSLIEKLEGDADLKRKKEILGTIPGANTAEGAPFSGIGFENIGNNIQVAADSINKGEFSKNISSAIKEGIKLVYNGTPIPVNGKISFTLNDGQIGDLQDYIKNLVASQIGDLQGDFQTQFEDVDFRVQQLQKNTDTPIAPRGFQV